MIYTDELFKLDNTQFELDNKLPEIDSSLNFF